MQGHGDEKPLGDEPDGAGSGVAGSGGTDERNGGGDGAEGMDSDGEYRTRKPGRKERAVGFEGRNEVEHVFRERETERDEGGVEHAFLGKFRERSGSVESEVLSPFFDARDDQVR